MRRLGIARSNGPVAPWANGSPRALISSAGSVTRAAGPTRSLGSELTVRSADRLTTPTTPGGLAEAALIEPRAPTEAPIRMMRRAPAALRRWLNTIDPNPLEERGQFLLKVFFGEHGDPGRLVAHLERFRDQAERKLETLRALDAEQPDLGSADLPRMTLRQGLAGTEAQLRWAEEILPELRDWAESRGGRPVPFGAGGSGT